MGLKCSPDYSQEVMKNIFRHLEDTNIYIDDVGAFSTSWTAHIKLLDEILSLLKDIWCTVKPIKFEWAVKETDWLVYWLMPICLKTWKKKVDAILQLERPKTIKHLRAFLGAVNYYRDMWPRRAYVLKPLTDKSGTKTFVWTDEMEK